MHQVASMCWISLQTLFKSVQIDTD